MALTSVWADWTNDREPEPNFFTPTEPIGGPGSDGLQGGPGYEQWYYDTLYGNLPSVIAAQSTNSPGNMLYNQLHPPQGPPEPQQFVTAEQQNATARYQEVMRELAKAERLGPDIFTGDLNSYARQILGSLPMTPEIQNRIGQIQNTFRQIRAAGVNVLPSGSGAPLGDTGRAPTISLNPTTGQWDWFAGQSPTQLQAPGGANLAANNNPTQPFNLNNPAFTSLFTNLNGPNGNNPLGISPDDVDTDGDGLPGGSTGGGSGTGTGTGTGTGGGNNQPNDGFQQFLQMMQRGSNGQFSPWEQYSIALDRFIRPDMAQMFSNVDVQNESAMRQYYNALNTMRGQRGMPTFWDLYNNAQLQSTNPNAPNQAWYKDNSYRNAPYQPTSDPGMFQYLWNDPDGAQGANPGGWGLTFDPTGMSYDKLGSMAGLLNSRTDLRNKPLIQDPLNPFFSQNAQGQWNPVGQNIFDLSMFDVNSRGYNDAIESFLISQAQNQQRMRLLQLQQDLANQASFDEYQRLLAPLRAKNYLPGVQELLNNSDAYAGTALAEEGYPYLPSIKAPTGWEFDWLDPDGAQGANPGALGMYYKGQRPTNYSQATQLLNVMNDPKFSQYRFNVATGNDQMFTPGTGTNRYGVNQSFFNTQPPPGSGTGSGSGDYPNPGYGGVFGPNVSNNNQDNTTNTPISPSTPTGVQGPWANTTGRRPAAGNNISWFGGQNRVR